jgi:hypothetical protein
VHLFLIPLKRANGDSQMIFVLAEHTPFAAGAKRRDPTGKFIKFQKNLRWDVALRRVGSAFVGVAERRSVAKRRHAFTDVRGEPA